MNRVEHLQWCKDRAMEYVAAGDLQQAFASFSSDMSKHPETATHTALRPGRQLFFSDNLNTKAKMKHWIEGFN